MTTLEQREQQEHMMTREVVDDIFDMLCAKNSNYGRNLQRHGLRGIVIRLGDKQMRLENVVLGEQTNVVGETVTDTLMDQAGYAVRALVLQQLDDLTLEGEWRESNGMVRELAVEDCTQQQSCKEQMELAVLGESVKVHHGPGASPTYWERTWNKPSEARNDLENLIINGRS